MRQRQASRRRSEGVDWRRPVELPGFSDETPAVRAPLRVRPRGPRIRREAGGAGGRQFDLQERRAAGQSEQRRLADGADPEGP